MNNVSLIGRLTRDPDVRYTDGGSTVCRFNLAVDRRIKAEGKDSADFISCVAFGKTAEFVEKYFHQGNRLGLNGRIQTGNYTNKDGLKVYTTDVIIENVEFVDSKNNSDSQRPEKPLPDSAIGGGFVNIPDGVEDEGLPFN